MTIPSRSLRLDQPATYRITVQGRLNASWGEWFDGMAIFVSKTDGRVVSTSMTGLIRDQAALHGLLARTRDLGLPLLQVQFLKIGPPRPIDPESDKRLEGRI